MIGAPADTADTPADTSKAHGGGVVGQVSAVGTRSPQVGRRKDAAAKRPHLLADAYNPPQHLPRADNGPLSC